MLAYVYHKLIIHFRVPHTVPIEGDSVRLESIPDLFAAFQRASIGSGSADVSGMTVQEPSTTTEHKNESSRSLMNLSDK
jgi:hypothetical protein